MLKRWLHMQNPQYQRFSQLVNGRSAHCRSCLPTILQPSLRQVERSGANFGASGAAPAARSGAHASCFQQLPDIRALLQDVDTTTMRQQRHNLQVKASSTSCVSCWNARSLNRRRWYAAVAQVQQRAGRGGAHSPTAPATSTGCGIRGVKSWGWTAQGRFNGVHGYYIQVSRGQKATGADPLCGANQTAECRALHHPGERYPRRQRKGSHLKGRR